jgi:uncharacterized lipoprotein YajG
MLKQITLMLSMLLLIGCARVPPAPSQSPTPAAQKENKVEIKLTSADSASVHLRWRERFAAA